MHDDNRSGQLTGTAQQLRRLCRCTESELVAALQELGSSKAALVSERNGVFTVINRRMSRESHVRENAKIRQQHHRVRKRSRESNAPSSYSSSLSGGREPLRASPPPSGGAPPKPAGGGPKSRFSLEQCLAFARSAKGIDSPDAFAKTIWRSGEDDERIAKFLEPPAQKAEITKSIDVEEVLRTADDFDRMGDHKMAAALREGLKPQ